MTIEDTSSITEGTKPAKCDPDSPRNSSIQQQHQTPAEKHSSPPSSTISVGEKVAYFSDFINDNLVAARYGTFATITLLTAFGLSRTPIFFRFRTVSEIPREYFSKRRILHGRIVHVVENDFTSAYSIYSIHGG